MKKLRIYLDTSIINHLKASDAPDLEALTIEFFEHFVKTGFYDVYISPIVINEIQRTRNEKRKKLLLDFIKQYPINFIETESINNEVKQLASIYVNKGLIPEKKIDDALHIAVVTIKELDILLSWNYRHLANVNKELKIHAINMLEGYTKDFRMTTPLEVLSDDE